MNQNNRIKKLIHNANIVSFDIFDTLIKRKVGSPKDIFELVQDKYNSFHSVQIQTFAKERIIAEAKCRACSDKEIQLEDIYHLIKKKHGENANELKKIEIDLEIKLSYANPVTIKLYQKALKEGKKVLLITDMYLSKSDITKILSKNGIRGYTDLYVSSECGYRKSTGELYKFVRNQECIKVSDRWLHFGNNLKSDIINACQNSIYPVYMRKKKRISDGIKYCIMTGDPDYDFGYNCIGPLMIGFTKWIGNQLAYNDIKKVFFFSREGYFIKKCFEHYYIGSKYEARYLYVSRKSITTPVLSEEVIFDDLSAFRTVGVKNALEYMLSLGVSETIANDFIASHGLKGTAPGAEILRYKSELKAVIKEANKNKLDLLCKYLRQEGVNGNFAIVDIGWTGSMQATIDTVLSIDRVDHKMIGLFLAQRPEMEKLKKFCLNNKGWLCSYDGPYDIQNILLSSTGLIESIFMAPHGTTVGYKSVDGCVIEPIIDAYEYKGDYEKISRIQKAALAFVEDYISVYADHDSGFEENLPERFLGFLKNPSRVLADRYGEINLSDTRENKIAVRYRGINPIRHLKKYNDSYWKVGYLRRNVPFRLPYMTIYKYTRTLGMRLRKQ